jgi:hypothetical protein
VIVSLLSLALTGWRFYIERLQPGEIIVAVENIEDASDEPKIEYLEIRSFLGDLRRYL